MGVIGIRGYIVGLGIVACKLVNGEIVPDLGPSGGVIQASSIEAMIRPVSINVNFNGISGSVPKQTTVFSNASWPSEGKKAVCGVQNAATIDRAISSQVVADFAAHFDGLHTSMAEFDDAGGAGAHYNFHFATMNGKRINRRVQLTFINNFSCGTEHKYTAAEITEGFRLASDMCTSCDEDGANNDNNSNECTKHLGIQHEDGCTQWRMTMYDTDPEVITDTIPALEADIERAHKLIERYRLMREMGLYTE